MTDSTPHRTIRLDAAPAPPGVGHGCDRIALRQTATDVLAEWLRANGGGK